MLVHAPIKMYYPEVISDENRDVMLQQTKGCIEYIRKDALLEWAEEHNCEQGFDDGGAEHGYKKAIRDLISKINSL